MSGFCSRCKVGLGGHLTELKVKEEGGEDGGCAGRKKVEELEREMFRARDEETPSKAWDFRVQLASKRTAKLLSPSSFLPLAGRGGRALAAARPGPHDQPLLAASRALAAPFPAGACCRGDASPRSKGERRHEAGVRLRPSTHPLLMCPSLPSSHPSSPFPPLQLSYSSQQLDLLALLFTTVKVAFVGGALACAARLCELIEAARRASDVELHTTLIRNEAAYFGCVQQVR